MRRSQAVSSPLTVRSAVLRGLHSGRGAQAVERRLQDRLEIAGVTVNVADNMWDTSTSTLDAAFRRR